ncbi:MAG: amidohydrolase family protein [Phycisphaerales bacterium]
MNPELPLLIRNLLPGKVLLSGACLAGAASRPAGLGDLLLEVGPDFGGFRKVRGLAPRKARVLGVGVGAPTDVPRVDASGWLLMPGLVNAHTHLDLTHIGPRPAPAGFREFIDIVRAGRHSSDEAIARSVEEGVSACLSAGVVAVGDIAGVVAGRACAAPARALAATGLHGVSFLEFFALGTGESAGLEHMREELARAAGLGRPGFRVGVQPHAPYSASSAAFEAASGLGVPRCTHLAESAEEARLVAGADGPLRDFLAQVGVWTAGASRDFGAGASPVAHLAPVLQRGGWTVVHVNQASDADIALLARARARVVYCPRASAYFGAERAFGPHRYRDMLRAGVDVALGTDSVINLPRPDLSVWEEMKLLRSRDGVPGETLLRMATIGGARALGLDHRAFEIRPGATLAGLVAVRSEGGGLDAALAGGNSPVALLLGDLA